MEKVILIHGMACYLDECFGKGVKASLDNAKIPYYEPQFEFHPNISYKKWCESMQDYRQYIDDDTIFVCHSLGTNFIIKYLAEQKLTCKAVIAVAGGVVSSKLEMPQKLAYLYEFCPTDKEFKYCQKAVPFRYNIFNKEDHIWTMQQLKRYADKLKAKPVELEYGGHFGRSSGVKDLPIISKIIAEDLCVKNEQNVHI